MSKFINVFLVLTLLLTVLAGCTKKNVNEAPSKINMILNYGNEDVSTNFISPKVAESKIYDMSIFTMIASDNDAITYTELESIISMEFQEEPNSYEMKEYILNKDGTLKYDSNTIRNVPIKFENRTGSFILDENLAVSFSSNLNDYELRSVFRGFIFVGTWGDVTQSYYFIIKTDPYYQ